jgi:hypothetical protein
MFLCRHSKSWRGLKITAEKDSQKQAAKTDSQAQESTEYHRYILAMVFIGSFMVIMGLAVLGTIFWGYTGIANLVGFFSGWIAAMIGFYFLQQNAAGAQAAAKVATDSAVEEHALAHKAEDQKSRLALETSTIMNKLAITVNEILSRSEELRRARELRQPEDVQTYQTQVERLSREAKEEIKSAQDTILRCSTS